MANKQWLGQLSPGLATGGSLPLSVSMTVRGAQLGRDSERQLEEQSAGWWKETRDSLLAHRQTITPCLSKPGGQASPSFLPHVLAYQCACCPVTTDSLLSGCIFTSLHLVKKKVVGSWSRGQCILPCSNRAWKAKL